MAHVTSPDSWIGLEVSSGRYRVIEQLGAGGMAYVYHAHDRNLDCSVVLKVPRIAMLEDATFVKRFRSEIQSLVKLRHPHVVSVLDVDEHNGVPFAVMQLLSGGTLLSRLKGLAKLQLTEQLDSWLPDIARAIDFTHSQGYVHRDIKPENILFDEYSHAYLSDFGVIKAVLETEQQTQSQALTQNGVLGTPEYMAPEMILGNSFDGRVDQYALAITVYELLAGRRPFEAPTATAVLVAHTREEAPDLRSIAPDVSDVVADSILKAISKDPFNRFKSCEEFADVLLGKLLPKQSLHLSDSATSTESSHVSKSGLFETKDTDEAKQVEDREGLHGEQRDTVNVRRDDTIAAPLEGSPSKNRSRSGRWVMAGSAVTLISALAIAGIAYWMRLPPPWVEFTSELNHVSEQLDSAKEQLSLLESFDPFSEQIHKGTQNLDRENFSNEWERLTGDAEAKVIEFVKSANQKSEEASTMLDDLANALENRSEQFVIAGGSPFAPGLLADQERITTLREEISNLPRLTNNASDKFEERKNASSRLLKNHLEFLDRVETHWSGWRNHEVFSSDTETARRLLTSANDEELRTKLHSMIASSSGDEKSSNLARDAVLDNLPVPEEAQSAVEMIPLARFCCRQLDAGNSRGRMLELLVDAGLLSVIPVEVCIDLANKQAVEWHQHGLIGSLVDRCETPDQRIQLLQIQSRIKSPEWTNQILREFENGGPLAKRPENAVEVVLESRWASLYPIPVSLLQSDQLKLTKLPDRFQNELASLRTPLVQDLAAKLIKSSDSETFRWALSYFRQSHGSEDLPDKLASPRARSRAFNILTRSGEADAVADAQNLVVADYKGAAKLDYDQIDFGGLREILKQDNERLYRQIQVASWRSENQSARSWVVHELIPKETVDFLSSLRSTIDQQGEAGSKLAHVFDKSRKYEKPRKSSPFRGTEAVYFQAYSGFSFPTEEKRDIGEQRDTSELTPSQLASRSESHLAVIDNLVSGQSIKHFPGLREELLETKDFVKQAVEFLEVHGRLVKTCSSLKGQSYYSRIYLVPSSYSRLSRSITEQQESFKSVSARGVVELLGDG